MLPRSEVRVRRVFAVASTVALLAADAAAAPRFASLSARDAAALERARTGAARRLEREECQQVLSDFTDPEGRTLRANLESWPRTPSDYLRQVILFADGSTLEDCKRAAVLLVTSRGHVTVFACPAGGSIPGSRFARYQAEHSTRAEMMIIHEMLHTLGLAENPPSPFEITDRVAARCR
jgi:hypothetical protein